MDETSGVALALKTGVPTYQVEDEEGKTHLLIHLAIEDLDRRRTELGAHPYRISVPFSANNVPLSGTELGPFGPSSWPV